MHDQAHDPDSLFRRMRTLIERYRDTPELAWGAYEVLDADDPGVLAHISSLPEGAVLALHNFSGREVTATTNVPGLKGGRLLTDIFTGDTVKSAARRPRPHRTGAVRLSLAARPPLNTRSRACHGHALTLQSPATALMGALPLHR